jgi:hypothetical protein
MLPILTTPHPTGILKSPQVFNLGLFNFSLGQIEKEARSKA